MPPPESSFGHNLGWEANGSAAAFLLAPMAQTGTTPFPIGSRAIPHTQAGDPGATELSCPWEYPWGA